MGANIINTLCESLGKYIEKLIDVEIPLKILTNLPLNRLVKVDAKLSIDKLSINNFNGDKLADKIILMQEIAEKDPYRAVTHNKGIFNGITAVALATGQDTRSIEAAGHSYASYLGNKYHNTTKDLQYYPLTK